MKFIVVTSLSSLVLALVVAAVGHDWGTHWPGVWYFGTLAAFVVRDAHRARDGQ